MNNDNDDCEMITTLHNFVKLARRLDIKEIERAISIITGTKKEVMNFLELDTELAERAAGQILRACALTLFYVRELKTFYPMTK